MLPSKRSTGAGVGVVESIAQIVGRKRAMTWSLQLEEDSDSRHFRAGFTKSGCSRQVAMAEMLDAATGPDEQLGKEVRIQFGQEKNNKQQHITNNKQQTTNNNI
jgi:hypothetical protein